LDAILKGGSERQHDTKYYLIRTTEHRNNNPGTPGFSLFWFFLFSPADFKVRFSICQF